MLKFFRKLRCIPEFIDYIKYSDRKVVKPDSIYSLRLHNIFITISEIMKVKDETYNRALNEIRVITELIDKELGPKFNK